MRGIRQFGAWLACLSTFAVVVACGVNPQTHPVPLDVKAPPQQTTAPPPDGDASVTVYFVRNGRLLAVTRPATDTSISTALALLLAGPNGAEATMGVQSALVPQQLTATTAGGVVTIAATRDFTSISGDNQLLAAAQLVYTITDKAPTQRVRITVGGKVIDVPTDQGLARDPVERNHYLSVAPELSPSTPPATPGPPTSKPS